MGGLCSKSVKGEKVFAKTDGHSDNHKSDGNKNHKSTTVPSDLTSKGDHGVDKKKQESGAVGGAAAAAGTGSDDFYDGIPRYNDSFPHKSRSVRSSKAAVAKVGYLLLSLPLPSVSLYIFILQHFVSVLNL